MGTGDMPKMNHGFVDYIKNEKKITITALMKEAYFIYTGNRINLYVHNKSKYKFGPKVETVMLYNPMNEFDYHKCLDYMQNRRDFDSIEECKEYIECLNILDDNYKILLYINMINKINNIFSKMINVIAEM